MLSGAVARPSAKTLDTKARSREKGESAAAAEAAKRILLRCSFTRAASSQLEQSWEKHTSGTRGFPATRDPLSASIRHLDGTFASWGSPFSTEGPSPDTAGSVGGETWQRRCTGRL